MINLEHPLILICGLCGLIYLIAGLIQWKFPPKKINSLYGYRTKTAMKTEERWSFAQEFSSRVMIFCGIVMICLSSLSTLFEADSITTIILCILSIFLPPIYLVVVTESKIKVKFPI